MISWIANIAIMVRYFGIVGVLYIAFRGSSGATRRRVMWQGSGGVRKVRWARAGTGKSGWVRVCYYTRNAAGQILLLVIYAKSVRASIPGAVLKQIKEVLDHDD